MNHSVLAGWLIPTLERTAFRDATAVIGNTRPFVAALAERYPSTPVLWIPNAVDPESLPPPPTHPYPPLSIAHVGTIYGGRDPRPVLVALRRFLDRHPEARGESCFRLAGDVAEPFASALRRDVAAFELKDSVQIVGVLPRDDALLMAARSSLAVVLAQEQDLQVPAKLYEMASLSVPTVVIASHGSASAEEAVRLGASHVAPDDIEGLAAVMERAWKTRMQVTERPRSGSASYAQVARQLDAILSAHARGDGSSTPPPARSDGGD